MLIAWGLSQKTVTMIQLVDRLTHLNLFSADSPGKPLFRLLLIPDRVEVNPNSSGLRLNDVSTRLCLWRIKGKRGTQLADSFLILN